MAIENGIGMTWTIDDSGGTGRDVSTDVLSATIAMPSGVQDVTGMTSTGFNRLHLLADLSITLTAGFNDAATTGFHTVLKNYRTLFTAQVGRTVAIAHSGQTLTEEILFSDYSMARGQDGSLIVTAPGNMSDGTLGGWS